MLTHKNIISLVQAATEFFVSHGQQRIRIEEHVNTFQGPVFTELETLISYLPLAHSYEQTIEVNHLGLLIFSLHDTCSV